MKALLRKETGIFVLIVALCIMLAVKNPRFYLVENLQDLARLVGIYGVFSIGAGIVIITSGIDLSVGSMLALLGWCMVTALTAKHWPPLIAFSAVLVLGALIGAFHGFLITKVKLQPFIVTLCGLLFYRGIARFFAGDSDVGLTHEKALNDFMAAKPLGIPIPFLVLVVVAVVMAIVLHRSVWGRHLYAAGRNEEAARFSGINTNRVISSAYVLGGFFTAISAILLAFFTGDITASSHGNFFELYGIAAAVLGGCSLRGGEGSIVGIILGTILLQLLQNLVNLLGIESSLNFAVMGAVILLGVLADQLFSKRRAKKVA